MRPLVTGLLKARSRVPFFSLYSAAVASGWSSSLEGDGMDGKVWKMNKYQRKGKGINGKENKKNGKKRNETKGKWKDCVVKFLPLSCLFDLNR